LDIHRGANAFVKEEWTNFAQRRKDSQSSQEFFGCVAVTKGQTYQVEASVTGDSATDGGQTILAIVMK
jgi:hypothetical protein